MRIRRTDDDGVGLPGHAEVVGEPTVAGQQPLIFLAADRLADGADRGHGVDVDGVVHSRLPQLRSCTSTEVLPRLLRADGHCVEQLSLAHTRDLLINATLEEIKQRGWSVSFYCAYFAQTAVDNTVHLAQFGG